MQRLEEPAQEKKPDPLAQFIDHAFKSKPSRRSLIGAALFGGLGILASETRHAYASHFSVTDVDDDQIQSPQFSSGEFYEVEDIAEGSVVAPAAGFARIFRDSADQILKRKNPDDSIVSLESQGITDHGGLSGLADDDHTQYLLISGARAMSGDLDFGGNRAVEISQIRGVQDIDIFILTKGTGSIEAYTRSAGDAGNIKRVEVTSELAIASWIWQNSTHVGLVLGGDMNAAGLEIDNLQQIRGFQGTNQKIYMPADGRIAVYTENGSGGSAERFRYNSGSGQGSAGFLLNEFIKFNIDTFGASTDTYLGRSGANDDLILNAPSGGAVKMQLGASPRYVFSLTEASFNEPILSVNHADPPATANASFTFAKDVAGSSELFGFDEAGNAVQLTSHNFTLFTPDPSLPYPWGFYARNEFLGKEIGINIAQAVKDLGAITGKNYEVVKSFPKRSWSDSQASIKEKIDSKNRENARYDLIREEMKKELEVTKDEAIEQEQIEEREGLTTPIYDPETNEIIGEEPIMIPTGGYILNELTGELEPELIQDSIVLRTVTHHKIKDGYRLNRGLRKFYRNKTLAEAEIAVPSLRITYEKYTVKPPPTWLSDRGVN